MMIDSRRHDENNHISSRKYLTTAESVILTLADISKAVFYFSQEEDRNLRQIHNSGKFILCTGQVSGEFDF